MRYTELAEPQRQAMGGHVLSMRRDLDASQTAVALAAGLSRTMVYLAERGQAKKRSVYITIYGALVLMAAPRGITVAPFPTNA